MKKTLLDLITGCVTPREAKRFYRAMGGPDETQKFLEKVQKHYANKDKSNVPQFFDFLTRRLFGVEKSPLDLTPEEIERLSTVIEDRQDTLAYSIKLTPDVFTNPSADIYEDVKRMLPGIYTKHKMYFVNPHDLTLTPPQGKEPAVLHIKSRKRIIKEALTHLGLKEDVVERILQGEDLEDAKKQRERYRVDLTTVADADKLAELNPADLKKFQQVANAFFKKYDDGGSLEVNKAETPMDAYIVYRGELDHLAELFYAARRDQGSKYFPLDLQSDARVQQIINNLSTDRKA